MGRRRTPRGAGPAPTKVAFYIRVSALKGRGGDDFHSPEVQLSNLEQFVAPFNLTVVDAIHDIDVSGRSFSRDGVERIRELVEAGDIDAVAVDNITRFGRNVLESLQFIAWLRERGVALFSTKEQIDTTPAGQFMLVQFLAIAQLQSDQIGQAWADLIARRAELGIQHGTATIGYLKVNKRLVVDPVMGPAMTQAFARYARGWTISDITQGLNRVRDRRVDRRTVKAAFRKDVYRGKVVLHGRIIRDGLHEPLVDDATWELVQARLERDRTTPPRTLAVSHSLVGMVLCDTCSRTLKRNDEYQKTGKKVPRVCCSYAYKLYAPHQCVGIGNPRLDLIEAEALQQVTDYLVELQSTHQVQLLASARQVVAGDDVKRWRRELGEAQAALGRAAAGWARNLLTDAEYAAAVTELRADEQRLHRQLGDARSVVAGPVSAADVAATLAVLEAWPESTVSQRNRLLREIVREVRVRPAGYVKEPVPDRVRVVPW